MKSHPEPEEREPARKLFPCNDDTRTRFLAWRAEHNEWTDAAIGAQIGRSATMLYHYSHLDGNIYSGNVTALEKKLVEFMRDCRLEMDTNVPTVDCEVSTQVENGIEEIRTAKRIGLIIGAPGVGKSRGINRYCAGHELAISFVTRTWHRNTACAANALLEASDVTDSKKGLKSFEKLVEKTRGSARPILVDDAHKLTRGALQLLYDYRDETGAPIVLFGDRRLVDKLRDDGQRLRRTGVRFDLKIKNPRALITHHIDTLAPDANGERADLVKLCEKIVSAENGGHFGSLQMELSLAARLKRAAPEWNWCEAVRRAHQKLIRDYSL